MGGRTTDPRRTVIVALGIDLARIGWLFEHGPDGRWTPNGLATGGGNAVLLKVFGYSEQTQAIAGVEAEDSLHNLSLIDNQSGLCRVAWIVDTPHVVIHGFGPRQERTRSVLGLPTSAHPVGDEFPFIFGHSTPNLQQQLVVRVVAHR